MSNTDRKLIRNSKVEFLIFTSESGKESIEVRYEDETIWLSQKMMAVLFDVNVRTISKHLKNIFEADELDQSSVIRKFRITAGDGRKYNTKFYSFDAIIPVGYRVNSKRAAQFRQWATEMITQLVIENYTPESKMIRDDKFRNEEQVDHLNSETDDQGINDRILCQVITKLYAAGSEKSKDDSVIYNYFKKVRNNLYFSITGYTAPEIIITRADSSKEHMGLINWHKYPGGKILKTDVVITENYLTPEEFKSLENLIKTWIFLTENDAKNGELMTMEESSERFDKSMSPDFIILTEERGEITTEKAKEFAESEFEKYHIVSGQAV